MLLVASTALVLVAGMLGGDDPDSADVGAQSNVSSNPADIGAQSNASPDPGNVGEQSNASPETYPGKLSAESEPFAGFEDVAGDVGLNYTPSRSPSYLPYRHGAYVTDIENDGDEDVLLIGGEFPVLYENQGGRFTVSQRFSASRSAQVAHFFDYDNSGSEDLLLLSPDSTPRLYENRGGTFVPSNVTFDRSVPDPRTATSADFTGNGCLDVYIGSWLGENGVPPRDELLELGQNHPEMRPGFRGGGTNVLFAGDCGTFEDITESAGVNGRRWTNAVSAADFTGNGHIDIHVGNDYTTDYLYENQGNATFDPIDMGPKSDRNAMSSVAMDMTGNHLLDIFVTNIYIEDPPNPEQIVPTIRVANPHGNNLFANRGDGTFVDIAPEHGLERGSWGWAATVADYTNDGYLDIIQASMYFDPGVTPDQPDIFRPPQVWRGTNDSWKKINGFEVGFDQHALQGVVRVDYDADGALDFLAVDTDSPLGPGGLPGENDTFLYENQLESDEFVQLWVRDPEDIERNAGVYVETNERTIYREVNSRSDFQSQDSRLVHLGLSNEKLEQVVVEWPDGERSTYDGLAEGERYILRPDGSERVT